MPKPLSPVPSDLDIAQAADIKPIVEIAAKLGINQRHLIPFGHDKAKVHLDVLKDISDRPRDKYIDVTAITPTPLEKERRPLSTSTSPATTMR